MPQSILFVCTGNICRSPTADGILRGLAPMWVVDSCGMHGYHVGEGPDSRSQEIARAKGYDLSGLRARQFEDEDFERFDLILAMDHGHLAAIERLKPEGCHAKVELFLDYAGLGKQDVADPYYGEMQDFENCLLQIEEGVKALLAKTSN